MGELLTRMTLRGSLAQVRHVAPVPPDAADGLTARVYAQVERDFGMLAPPVVLHSPAPGSLAACWLMLRESLIATGSAGRAVKEAVATAVSRANSCPYCVAVHRATLHGLERGRHAAEIAEDRVEALTDPGMRAIAAWARASGTPDEAARRDLPVPPREAAELVAVAVTFQYLNRMVNVFLGESPLPPEVPPRARRGLMRLFGLLMTPAARRTAAPGDSLGLLPAAPLPADLSWADHAPHVAEAFARSAAAADAAGRRSVPEPVRELVLRELADWDGRPPGPGRAWTEGALSRLPADCRPAGRLALLTAMASYQVDGPVVEDFRRTAPGDRSLVELTSWASMAAARRIGGWALPARAEFEPVNVIPSERTGA